MHPSSNKIASHKNDHGVMRCDNCYTEFRVDFKSYGSDYNAMFVTRWLDLGDGCDPTDVKWKSRIRPGYMPAKVKFQRGSICSRFEGRLDSEFVFDAHMDTDKILKTYCRLRPSRLFSDQISFRKPIAFSSALEAYAIKRRRVAYLRNKIY
jgi:hypothetical protein